jgi:hypothetical protein
MELGARVGVYRGDAQLTASFLLSDGSFTLYVPVTGGVSEATNQTAWTQNLSDLQHLWGFVTAPANAVKCYMEVRVKRTTTAAQTDLYIALPYIGKAGAAQTVYSPWNQGVFITPSEVTTWIANAAIGNAQIGGDIYSSTYAWNGGNTNGWLLQRNGNLYCGNAYVRGNVEASSLKANTAMVNRANIVNAAVDTLQIAGNAITVPVSANGASSCQTAWTDFGGAPIALVVTGNGQHSYSGIGGTYIHKYLRIYRNGVLIKEIRTSMQYHPGGESQTVWNSGGTWVITDYPGAGGFYYTVSMDDGVSCGVLAIGVRR